MARTRTTCPPVIALWLAHLAAACTRPPYDIDESLPRLRGVDPRAAHQRRLSELDVSGDGTLDARDWQVFEHLANAATLQLRLRSQSILALDGLYHGLDERTANPFTTIARGHSGFALSGLTGAQLRVLAIEARWMALQARMARLADGRADDRLVGGALLGTVPHYNAERMEPAAVCRSIDELDLTGLQTAGLPAVAIFDLDSTVWAENVMDPFLAVLVAGGVPKDDSKIKDFLKSLKGADAKKIDEGSAVESARMLLDRWSNKDLPAEMRINAKDTFYNIVGLMRGMTLTEAEAAARKAYQTGAAPFEPWKNRIFTDRDGCGMRQIVEKLQARGIEVYFLSATLDVLAWEGGRLFGAPRERVLGSLLEVKDGRYTGEVLDSTYYTKGAIVRQWLSAPPLLAFGDSPRSDFTMLLEAVGAGFMINPRRSLLDRDREEAGSRLVAVSFDSTEGSAEAKP